VREKRLAEAVPLFRCAAERQPDNARFAYVWAVAVRSSGRPTDALPILADALKRSPNDRELLYALAAFNGEDGHRPAAAEYAHRFVAVAPDDPRSGQLAAAFGLR
jgi:Flp pilus assembly protein TadD